MPLSLKKHQLFYSGTVVNVDVPKNARMRAKPRRIEKRARRCPKSSSASSNVKWRKVKHARPPARDRRRAVAAAPPPPRAQCHSP